MKTPKQTQPGASGTLLFADLILGHARRLENLATKPARLKRFASADEAGEVPHNPRANYCERHKRNATLAG